MKPVCLVTGVGPGTGRAIVERFSKQYVVAMLARKEDRLARFVSEIDNTHAYPCDVAVPQQLTTTLETVRSELGHPAVVIHNAVGGAFGEYLDIDRETLQKNFDVNVLAMLQLAQEVTPHMIEQGQGAFICTGNTSAFRGSANFSGFAPTKAAQRILAESMARAAGPKGVHVAYVAIDAVINLEWTRKRFKDKPDDFFCEPGDIAEHVWQVAHQAKSAWTFESVIRPFGEKW
ncbi:MAG TPA: SDR family NAD(P)-dependent oxidoreductase [Gammaproteobacteria bacterium]|nr:SDR family NAD(P)-dependent oxidoreductase [Gammaproteobacteria bacterium]HIL98212.1 SDR family NAD(P)-dependent oxidoreductase [Pseudomonadales bacterium]